MRFRLLGPVQVETSTGAVVALSRRKERCLLAILLLEAGRVVPTDRLSELLWEDPPAQVGAALRSQVAHIRAVLARAGAELYNIDLVSQRGGYQLHVEPDRVDAYRFRAMLKKATTIPDLSARDRLLRDALALWRGPALHDAATDRVRQRLCADLDELRALAGEEAMATGIALGRHREILPDLTRLRAEHPTRERLAELQMLALYRDGRTADASLVYHAYRERLADRLGLDPGPELSLLHDRILRRDPSLDNVATASGSIRDDTTIVFTLPADTAAFTGRDREFDETAGRVLAAAQAGGASAVHLIDGMPGVGKTAFAVHVAHRLADRFPDRQLFVDLHTHTAGQGPADPTDVLAMLLSADGVDVRHVPDSLDGRAAMWRDRMARRRAVLVLDDAASSNQIMPLLPGSSSCLVLVTSRRFLGDLATATVAVPLEVLPTAEAMQMFVRLDPAAATQPAAVAELVELCGRLPLAISLLARLHTRHPTWTVHDLITETQAGLLTATAENRTIAAAFDLSYRYLHPNRQRVLRQLGLHPGQDVDPYAAAALTDMPPAEVVAHLDGLNGNRLLSEVGYHRYRMHDLIRGYAGALAATDPEDARQAALDRLLTYYQHAAELASTFLTRQDPIRPAVVPAAVPDFPGEAEAHAWLTTERANLLACIRYAMANRTDRVVGLVTAVAGLLRNTGPWMQAIELYTGAAAVAEQHHDRLGQARALTELGIALRLTGDYTAAVDRLRQARHLFRAIADRRGEANVLTELGIVQRLSGEYAAASTTLRQALDLHQCSGDKRGQANTLTELGGVLYAIDDYVPAAEVLRRALDLLAEVGDRRGTAAAVRRLGAVRYMTGDYLGGAADLTQALNIHRDIGDRPGHASALGQLGLVRCATGDYTEASRLLRQAFDMYENLGDPLGQANSLTYLSAVNYRTGEYEAATSGLQRALNLSRDIGYRLGQANALMHLGAAHRLAGDHLAAVDLLRQALAIYDKIGNRDGEAETLNHLGAMHLSQGEVRQAREDHHRALCLAREFHSPLEEARALEGLGRCELADDHTDRAVDSLRRALRIYRRLGAVEALHLTAELDRLTVASDHVGRALA